MKIACFLLVIVYCGFSTAMHAQESCCDKLRQAGIELYNKGNYTDAIKKWEAAKTCATKCKTDDLNSWIGKAKAKLMPPNPKPVVKPIEPQMVFVKGGTFTMGCKDGRDTDCDDDEKPAHQVTLSDFYIGKYEVTFEEYDAFCEATERKKPSDEGWGIGKRPAINISWEDATAYCDWLSQKTGKNYRLPTEAEWEYAARGGNKSKGYLYAGSNTLSEVAWYSNNSNSKTHPVGQKKANELGLYDMSGNVYEWCADVWHNNYEGAPTNGSAWTSGGDQARRVVRGGSWNYYGYNCRVSRRYYANFGYFNFGFRLAGY